MYLDVELLKSLVLLEPSKSLITGVHRHDYVFEPYSFSEILLSPSITLSASKAERLPCLL